MLSAARAMALAIAALANAIALVGAIAMAVPSYSGYSYGHGHGPLDRRIASFFGKILLRSMRAAGQVAFPASRELPALSSD